MSILLPPKCGEESSSTVSTTALSWPSCSSRVTSSLESNTSQTISLNLGMKKMDSILLSSSMCSSSCKSSTSSMPGNWRRQSSMSSLTSSSIISSYSSSLVSFSSSSLLFSTEVKHSSSFLSVPSSMSSASSLEPQESSGMVLSSCLFLTPSWITSHFWEKKNPKKQSMLIAFSKGGRSNQSQKGESPRWEPVNNTDRSNLSKYIYYQIWFPFYFFLSYSSQLNSTNCLQRSRSANLSFRKKKPSSFPSPRDSLASLILKRDNIWWSKNWKSKKMFCG